MITEEAADGVEFIFGTAFKEDMQDEMTITVIAAGYDDPETASADADEDEEDVIRIDNPLIDDLDLGKAPAKPRTGTPDYDLDDIFKMLGN